MYPWIRDAAAAAAAAAVGYNNSHQHQQQNHNFHHQLNVSGSNGNNMNSIMNGIGLGGGGGLGSSGGKHENNFNLPPSNGMLVLDYAQNKKSAAAAFLWTNGTGSSSATSPHSLSPDSTHTNTHHQHHSQLQPYQHQLNSLKHGPQNLNSNRIPNANSISSNNNHCNSSCPSPRSISPSTQSQSSPSHSHVTGNNGLIVSSSQSGHPVQQYATAPGNNAQLMHWMSAVMAEHIHHGVDGIHYVWNGAGEGKLNSSDSHHHNHNSLKSSDIDPTSPTHPNSMYGAPRSVNSGSSLSSSPPSSAGIVVPQPLTSGPGNGKSHSTTNGGSGRKYQCKMCPQVGIFTSKADLQLHSQMHMREAKPYKCSQCTKTFANSSYLSQHTRIHLGVKPYRCEICQRKFTQLSHLQQHIRTHTGDKPYKCRHGGCNKAFSQLSNLQSHSRCHQTDKPYKCNSCYKCFQDEASLLDHIPKHKESKHLKTHICSFCGKSYTQETYLAKHLQKHTEKAEKRMNRHNNHHNNNNNNSTNHHQNSGTTNSNNQNSHSTVTNNHQGSNNNNSNNNVLSSSEMYWKNELGESSPPTFSTGGQGLLGRQSSEGPDDLRVNNLGQHHQNNQPSTVPTIPYDALANAIASSKAVGASAFTPIQTGAMLQIPTNMGGQPGTRAYLPYEPLSFQKTTHHHQMSAMDMKSSNPFPNQLISLHQIRNYAHQPSMTPEHLLGLKDK